MTRTMHVDELPQDAMPTDTEHLGDDRVKIEYETDDGETYFAWYELYSVQKQIDD